MMDSVNTLSQSISRAKHSHGKSNIGGKVGHDIVDHVVYQRTLCDDFSDDLGYLLKQSGDLIRPRSLWSCCKSRNGADTLYEFSCGIFWIVRCNDAADNCNAIETLLGGPRLIHDPLNIRKIDSTDRDSSNWAIVRDSFKDNLGTCSAKDRLGVGLAARGQNEGFNLKIGQVIMTYVGVANIVPIPR